MNYDNDIERILQSNPVDDPRWQELRQENAAKHRLVPLPDSYDLIKIVLADGIYNSLGGGAFSRVYALDKDWVLKLCRDWTTLEIMETLQSQSSCFPRVKCLMRHQAVLNDVVYHGAVIERLEDTFPLWVRSVVDAYRQPFRASSASLAQMRLNILSFRIGNGEIKIPQRFVKPFTHAVRLLADVCSTTRSIADLRYEGNFMMRKNGDVVISDPAHPESEMNS